MGTLSGIGYLLRKASHWQPMEDIIRLQMNRNQQQELVLALVNVCTQQQIDPERAESFVPNPSNSELELSANFVLTLLDFFRVRLRMQQ